MRSAHIAPVVVTTSLVGASGALGAPAAVLLWMAGIMAVAALLSGGVGAAALANLARKRYDAEAWAQDWSSGYLDDPRGARDGQDEALLAIDLMPDDDLRATKAWLGALEGIRALPEASSAARRR